MFAAVFCSSLASRRCRHSALEKGAQCSGTQLSSTGVVEKYGGYSKMIQHHHGKTVKPICKTDEFALVLGAMLVNQ